MQNAAGASQRIRPALLNDGGNFLMTTNDEPDGSSRTRHGQPTGDDGQRLIDDPRPSWLLSQKIVIPDRVEGYLHRPELVKRTMPVRRRATVLKAPGGFGKTTLLSECCRRLLEGGIPVAWVSLDAHDEPELLDTYVAYACQSAGLDVLGAPDSDRHWDLLESRVAYVAREIESRSGPFVLAFDELEQLKDPGSVELLDFLLQRGPPNLHLAFSCRELPDGLNVSGALLEGRCEVVTTGDLRFSESEVGRFFDLTLSKNELARLMADSAGWPFALRIYRNVEGPEDRAEPDEVRDFVANWIESRLFDGLGTEDREFLLDLGLFEWLDADLVDAVLERNDTRRRIDGLPILTGLLEPVGGDPEEGWRLHPLVREHCARRRSRETPQRFRSIHRRIAEALGLRGETVDAMRHAVEAGEPELAGEILERGGGIHLWTRMGTGQFLAADRLLSEKVVATRPRLGLVRSQALLLSGRIRESRKCLKEVQERFRTSATKKDSPEGGGTEADFEFTQDEWIVRGNVTLHGGWFASPDEHRAMKAESERLWESGRTNPLTRGQLEFGLCLSHNHTADFDIALDWAARARATLVRSRFMTMYLDIQAGQIAMARGRVEEAEGQYLKARREARKSFVLDVASVAISEILLQELAAEVKGPPPVSEAGRVPGALTSNGTPYAAYAAACGTVIDARLREEGVDGALKAADEMLEYVCGESLPGLTRYVSALQVGLLAAADRTDEAERAWRQEGLPGDPEDCLQLEGQSWREMEALSCARIRLLAAKGEFGAARGLAGHLRAVAEARGLRRTLMRSLALSVVLENQAGETAAAFRSLEDYLREYQETPYAGPLVREEKDATEVVFSFLEAVPDSPQRKTAESLLALLTAAHEAERPTLSEREKDVLLRLESQQDKEIAAALGLSPHGVRYHIRKLFTKLGVSTRAEAVRRARELGLALHDI